MKRFLARLIGADRPKVIAVFGITRDEVERAVRHARTSASDLPVWAWCADEDAGPVPGCDRFTSGLDGFPLSVWPALSIVAWTGTQGSLALKLLPLLVPPFRVVVFNEADGFFPARPALIAAHAKRRLRDAFAAKADLCVGWLAGVAMALWSLLWRGGERVADGFNWIRESLFAVLARMAEWLWPLIGDLLLPPAHGHPWHFTLDEARDGSFEEVTIPDRGWPRRSILRTATRSNSEYLVLRKRGETVSAEPLIAAARQTNAFAVARQAAHSAWRKRLVAKHPFRTLQDGEVSEVQAPFSSLIVLRREALLRLGVPHAITAGAALMILFWKSSAAGLRSLVLGHDIPATDESAMALEDMELALRLDLSPRLAALGASRPARYRGNVAWSPCHTRGLRGKPRVLVVSPYLPFPLSHGGAVRIYNLCRALSAEVDFIIACFREANETVRYPELHEVFREVYVVDADEKHRDASVPAQVAEYRNSAMSDLIRTMCLERRVDAVQLEYTQLAEYRDDTGAVPVILVEHDITFTLYSQLADLNRDSATRQHYLRWLEFERAALQCSNEVWTMSADERAVALDHGAPRQRTRVIPNGVDLRRFKPTEKPDGPPVILFIGSFRHLPNLLAFQFLRRTIMPAVWQDCPGAVLHVIGGPDHERHAAALAGERDLLAPHPHIVVQGFVEDVRPAYRIADVVAIPLPVSAGTNIKLMEAMACGRAVVSTPAGCRGLGLTSREELIVAELDSSFSTALVELINDPGLRTCIARTARLTAEQRFGWDTIALDALASYLEFAPPPSQPSMVNAACNSLRV